MREIALDTETTGLDPAQGHRVVEIGCVEMMDRIRTGNTFQVYLNPERAMPEEAFSVHGLSDAFLADKPLFSAIVDDFLAFIGSDPLVIHNAQFDLKFLNAELRKVGAAPLDGERAIDTVQIARRKFPGAPAKLDALCKRFNISTATRTKHGALLDAELLSDVYLELMGGRQEAMSLQVSQQEADMITASAATTTFPLRSFTPSDEELEQHAVFIKKSIKNALWDA